MHFYFVTRGIKNKVDQMITELQGKYLPIKLKVNDKGQVDENGKETEMLLQLSVRPVQLWELAFPREQKDLVLNSILKGHVPNRPNQKEYRIFDKFLYPLRKILKVKKVGDYKKDQFFPVQMDAVDVFAIGTREDKDFTWGEGI